MRQQKIFRLDNLKILILLFSVSLPQKTLADLISDPSFNPKLKQPTYTKNGPAICMDLAHLNNKAEDGRYKPVLNLLKSDGYKIKELKTVFDQKSIKDCKILYISAPMSKSKKTSAFTKAEIDLIKNWVKLGGGLLLMTDHPTMFSEAPEELANAFGVKGSDLTVEDFAHTPPVLKDPTVIIFSGEQLNDESPIIIGRTKQERIKTVIAFTGQSLSINSASQSVLAFSKSAIEKSESNPSSRSANGRSEVISTSYGKGRVVISGDGTMFTSKIETKNNEKYGINRPGTDNVQFALNIFHWLSGILENVPL